LASRASRTWPDLTDRLKFLAEFFRSPLEVGSPIATACRTIERLLAEVEWGKVRCFLEYGPGTGEFTRYILEHLPLDARLIAIESDATLADHLRETISDRRLTVYTDSAVRTREILGDKATGQADYILSGIPFSSLEIRQREQIAGDISMLLGPQGQFLAYQVRRSIEQHLRAHFGTVKHRRAWRNLPPYHLYWCSNPKARQL
jgi:phospholipid N-methyltransferase